MSFTYKPHASILLQVPKFGSRTDFDYLQPKVISLKWSKNSYLQADELTITVADLQSGVDPRIMRNALCELKIWDASEVLDPDKHVRFKGVCVKSERRLGDDGWVVDSTFHDYTTFFIHNKPLKSAGMPTYDDTLQTIWERICDNTGWEDPANGKIVSSVAELKPNLRFMREDMAGRKLGELVNKRFLAAAKPTPKHGASSWDTWLWCISCLGLITYIEKDQCIVTDSVEHYNKDRAARVIYGRNIHSFEQNTDAQMSQKGVLLKSFDTLNGRVLEAFYPPPGDERLKQRRAAVGPKSEGGSKVTANEQSGDYEEFNRFDIQDQKALDRAALETYEQRSRQELNGSFKTSEPLIYTIGSDEPIDLLSLRAGDPIKIELDPAANRDVLLRLPNKEARIRYLMDTLEYDEGVANLIAANADVDEIATPFFHITSFEVDLGPDHFEIDCKFHNLITVTV